MDKPFSNKGFSLIETLIVLLLLTMVGTLTMRPFDTALTQSQDFQSKLIHTRFDALLTHQTITLETEVLTDYAIRFNAQGNINMGQTIPFKNKEVVLQIGTGRCYEKRVSDD